MRGNVEAGIVRIAIGAGFNVPGDGSPIGALMCDCY